jgi:YbbR domain-containing protein
MTSHVSRVNSFLNGIRHMRIENIGLKLLAVGVATLLFAVSRQPTSDVRLEHVPLEFRGVPPGLEISGEVDQTVSVRLRGPRDVVRGLMPNQIAVVADISDKEPGDRIIQLKTSDVSKPPSLDVLRVDPASIRLTIEPSVRRSVPVKPEITGVLENRYQIREINIQPPMVEIEGPKSVVNATDSVRTESIDLDGKVSSFTARVGVDHENHSVRVVTPGPVKVEVRIDEKATGKKGTGDEGSTNLKR